MQNVADVEVSIIDPTKTRHWATADLMLGRRRRLWTKIKPTMFCVCWDNSTQFHKLSNKG